MCKQRLRIRLPADHRSKRGLCVSVCNAATTVVCRYDAKISVSEDFHVYGLQWNKTHITFYFDGALTGSMCVLAALVLEVRGCRCAATVYRWIEKEMLGRVAALTHPLWRRYSPCLQQAIGMDFDRETVGMQRVLQMSGFHDCCSSAPDSSLRSLSRPQMPNWFGLPDPGLLPDVPFTIDYVRAWKSPALN